MTMSIPDAAFSAVKGRPRSLISVQLYQSKARICNFLLEIIATSYFVHSTIDLLNDIYASFRIISVWLPLQHNKLQQYCYEVCIAMSTLHLINDMCWC